MRTLSVLALYATLTASLGAEASAQVKLPDAKPVPRMQVLPLPHDQASVTRDGVELSRYHFGKDLNRPFLYPIVGPSGRSLTRMGHPRDPITHSHHNSVWISHHDLNGDSFWDDRGEGRIAHRKILRYEDNDVFSEIVAENAWIGKDAHVHVVERRGMTVRPLNDGDWLLVIDLRFEATDRPATFGKTPFGLIGVRMAKTIGVLDGGGLIRNSEGNVNEQGPNGVFWKPARWVDYSGPITPRAAEGITLFDHPSNPNHPSVFHVRGDGWMGASLTHKASLTIHPGKPLTLRYGLWVHAGVPEAKAIDGRWKAFVELPPIDWPRK